MANSIVSASSGFAGVFALGTVDTLQHSETVATLALKLIITVLSLIPTIITLRKNNNNGK